MEPICSNIFHLAECPLWNEQEQALYWTDILNGEIWRHEVKTKASRLFWAGDMQVGGFAFARNGDLILCSDRGVFRLSKTENGPGKLRLLFDVPFTAGERFNDVTTDPRGRLIAGTKRSDQKDGKLYLFESGRRPEVLLTGIGISNGMTFSLDYKHFYHTDSISRTITRFNYNLENGGIQDPAVFYQGTPAKGYPDGITLDAEGYVWVAFWGASCIRRISPEGKIIFEAKVPAIQPSSLMFGGEKLDELFITTACEGGADIESGLDETGNFLGGTVFCYHDSRTRGRLEWLADF